MMPAMLEGTINRRPGSPRPRPAATCEPLESRTLLAIVTVDADQVVRAVNPHVLGVNLNWWDTQLPTARTRQMVQEAGLNFFRFPGGSSSDEYHFSDPPSYNGRGTAATFANFVASVGGQAVVTLNYGTGSPQEAAAWLAYLNADPADATVIGPGQQWDDATGTWVQQDWRTAGYWAGVRAAAPLAQDDGLNFLRVGRPAAFGIHYFEIGNELYGSWEVDRHGQGGDTGLPHDPATYVAFAKRFGDYAARIDPTIAIGIDSGAVGTDAGWTARVLRAGLAIGFVPGFISDHLYMQAPGAESDAYLLTRTVSNTSGQSATDPHHWGLRAAGYRNLLRRNLGTALAAGVELLATEYNSVYSDPGKQTTSLVNGLFAADSIGALLQTEYNGANFWDLRNAWDTTNNNSASLYGWRQGGDYGLLGTGSGPAPSTGTYVPYPTYFAHQLTSKLIHAGGVVVSARSDDPLVSAYAVRQSGGTLSLLVINKSPLADLTQQFQIEGFRPDAAARVWRYGKAEDTAQGRTADGRAALTDVNATLALSPTGFSYTFPSYSMTVMELSAAPAVVVGRFVFYDRSTLDGGSAGTADDAAIATDKAALLPGQAPSFSNVTSYVRGINGIMVDIANLPAATPPLNADDFMFRRGASGNPALWQDAPAPVVAIRPGAGPNGSTRVTLTWPDTAVRNAWLQVTVKSGPRTGLPAPDVFYFGNLPGETGDGSGTLAVNVLDYAGVRRSLGRRDAASIARYDFNRDNVLNLTDLMAARGNLGRSLPLVSVAAGGGTARASESPARLPHRAMTRPVRRNAWAELQLQWPEGTG
jgi:hypothetical protein